VIQGAALSEDSSRLYDALLREAITYILDSSSALPTFMSRAMTEMLTRESRILESVEEVLSRLPTRTNSSFGLGDDADFELLYRRELSRLNDKVERLGMATPGTSPRRYRLDVAYLHLSASTQASVAGESSEQGAALLPIYDALGGKKLHLIRGEAGSGKTTLLQWLAVASAQNDFDGDLAGWNGKIPLLLSLRRFSHASLPTPEELVRHCVWTVAGQMPSGWMHRALTARRVLILLDGIDELPRDNRVAARIWLEELLETFPGNVCIVTARPPAITNDWISLPGFAISDIEPMDGDQVRSFIRRWHKAATLDSSPEESAELLRLEKMLMAVIDSSPALRALVTNPLLCALACALNIDRKGDLPRDRITLYRTALELLLERRDAERGIQPDGNLRLSADDQIIILQHFAWWLLLNEETDAQKSALVARVAEAIRSMPQVQASAGSIVEHLLLRCGLLREPVEGTVDFIHRTFLEYLGAKHAIESEYIPLLIKNAHRDFWREVIVLAIGHARPAERGEIFTGILERARHEPRVKIDLRATAIAGLETARQVDQKIYRRVLRTIKTMVPPSSRQAARVLALVGPDVLRLIHTEARKLQETEAIATIHTAALLGGSEALSLMAGFMTDPRQGVVGELVTDWSYFDAEEYAVKVLRDSPLMNGQLIVRDPGVIPALGALANLRDLDVVLPPYENISISPVPSAVRLTLTVNDNPSARDLEPLVNLRTLRGLAVHDCRVDSLPDWAQLPELAALRFIRSVDARKLSLEACPSLRALSLGVGYSWNYLLGVVPPLAKLNTLELCGVVDLMDLKEFANLAELGNLSLVDCRDLIALDGLDALVRLNRLELTGSARLRDIDQLQALPALMDLRLRECGPFESLEALALLGSLRRLEITHLTQDDLPGIAALPELEYLHIDDCTDIDDLTVLTGSNRLKHLVLRDEDCDRLHGDLLSKANVTTVVASRLMAPKPGGVISEAGKPWKGRVGMLSEHIWELT
jgi:hypothetical protein